MINDSFLVNDDLASAIRARLDWMIFNGYAKGTIEQHESILKDFLFFVSQGKIEFCDIITWKTLKSFQSNRNNKSDLSVIKSLSKYLYQEDKILHPISGPAIVLPEIFEQYLAYYRKNRQASDRSVNHSKSVFKAFNDYLEKFKIDLSAINIEQVDSFWTEFKVGYAPATCRMYRFYIRGFLSYLYHERKILKRDLARLIVNARVFTQAKPPKFLRPNEIQRLFDSVDLSKRSGIRTYAMLNFAYFLGLRPVEISKISLDDISFSKEEICLRNRKGGNPINLPLPENTIKAVAAYIIGVRPKSKHRQLFLGLMVPYSPILPSIVSNYIQELMKKAGLPSSPYWLRHTYAQNLLEAGLSIFEIKEMMGHDTIEATRRYLHIHIKLMREVLFDEI